MEDKLTNLLIGLIFTVVLVLAGIYVFKIVLDKPKPVVAQNSNNISTINNTKKTESTESIESTNDSLNIKIPLPETDTSNQNVVANQEKMVYHNNRFYYNQLDEYSKVVYDAVYENLDNLKKRNYKIKLDYDFSPLLSKNNDNTLINICFNDAINALNLDVSNLFYIDYSKMSLSIETTTTILGTKHELNISPRQDLNYLQSSFSSESDVENAINDLLNIRNQVVDRAIGDDYNKLVRVHDWLIEYMQYDSESANKNTIYGSLIERKAVCEGYARTFKYLLDELGIENVLIIGKAENSSGETEEHMWNYVKINDTWYAVDCTWDDPILANGVGTISYIAKHKYFMIGSNKLFETHTERKILTSGGQTFTLPELSKVDY